MTSTTAYEPRSDVLWPLGGMYVEGQWTSGPWTLDVTDPDAALGVRAAFVTPAVLSDVPHDAGLWRHEVFGPVVMIEPWDEVATAIDAANDVDTGLQAGVFTRDIDQALEIAERLRVGAVLINSSSDFRIDAMPFGGFKTSGIGREGITSAIDSLTEPKVVAIRRTPR